VVEVVVVVEVVLFLPFLRGPSWLPLASSGSSCCRWSLWRREGWDGMGWEEGVVVAEEEEMVGVKW